MPVTDVDDTTYPETEAQMGQNLANRTRYLFNSITWGFGAADTATFSTENEELLTSLSHPYTRLGPLNFFSQISKGLVGTVKYFSNRILGLSDTPKRTFLSIAPLNYGDNDWLWAEIAAGQPVLSQISLSSPAAYFDIPVPLGGFLRNITVLAQPLTGITHTGVPANKPVVTLYRTYSQSSALFTETLGSVTDPSASTGAYDVLHTISLDVSVAMVQSLPAGGILGYRLKVTGESGADAVPQGFCIAGITATFSRGGG